jgi:eukaryotic-like serine/threonine-protein kinase
MSLSPGLRVGTYEILSLIGVGGMGEVYRARDSRLKRDVAFKTLPVAWAADADRVARFDREAEMLATLNHPNIAAIYGCAEAAGIRALVLELVEGPTLAELVRRGPLPPDQALPIARQIVDALDTAHERGIVHRDLKPANIKVREDGTVKVLDFGLAKAFEGEPASTDATNSPTLTGPAATRAGVILGTAAYMSPEQARGHVVDRRTDIWAFGCVLYEMLTSHAPFAGETASDSIAAILQGEPDWSRLPAETPAALRSLLRRCLQKDRKLRLRDIGDARIELDLPAPAEAPRPEERASRRGSRAVLLGGAALALMAVTAAAVVGFERWRAAGSVATSRPSTPQTLVRATADAGVTADPALSNDGALLAYASDRAGADNLDVWVQQTAGSVPIQLTEDPVDEREPAFSPDGSRIAYRSERDGGGIYIVPALGGQEPRLLVTGGRRPRFSPDGRLVAYWTGSNVGFASATDSYSTFVIPAAGGEARRVGGFTGVRYPVWAGDGKSLLVLGSRDARPLPTTYDWWRVPLDGGEPAPVGAATLLRGAGIAFEAGNISPDDWRGDTVVFSSGAYLWRARLAQTTGAASHVERLTFGTNRDFQAAMAASGLIAFASASASNSIWALPVDSDRGQASGAPRRMTAGLSIDTRASASRDGKLLAYRSAVPRPTILIKNLDTGNISDLGVAGSGFGPALSPDGQWVSYEESDGVRVVSRRGGTPRTLCQLCSIGDWSPDSRAIVVVKDENNAGRLTWIELNGNLARDVIVSSDQTVNRPFPSPDGRLLAFRRTGPEGDAILIAPLSTDQPAPPRAWIRLVAPEEDARPSGWSPEGTMVYFVSGRDGARCLYAQRVDRSSGAPVGEPLAIRHFHSGGRQVFRSGLNVLSTGPANAVAGGSFIYDISELTSNIWLMPPRTDH